MASCFTLMLLILLSPPICILSSGGHPVAIKASGIDDAGPGYMYECSKDVILVYQGPTPPLPSGIPTYTVEIYNVCITGGHDTGRCNVSNIHLKCGGFSTARSINPSIFRRLDHDDCLVNDGEPMNAGQCVTFTYANSFPYPMEVSSVSCK
ncbi:hypothetical protein LIER_36479 [Lithospermum erythrorhizon]|uniref:Uncharacterized protein n=1 Tax=Lithospermum erythrorhizon TaxID=34254 RepID=A0AAV3P6U0_LITER